MSDIDQLLQAFDDPSEDRCWVVIQLQECTDRRVASLFLNSLANSSEDEGVKIEILKSLVMRSDPDDIRQAFAVRIINMLQSDPSDLVRQYSANALQHFPDINGVLGCLEGIVEDESEDLDVRHNALASIERNRDSKPFSEALHRLVVVPDLGRYAKRAVDEM